MGDKLLEVIKQVGIFMICAQMILHFRPSDSYKKYIKLLISIMVLVQLAVPFIEIFGKRDAGTFFERVDYYEAFINDSMQEADITSANAENLINEMTLREIKTRINNQKQEESAESGNREIQDSEYGEITIQIDRIEVTADE